MFSMGGWLRKSTENTALKKGIRMSVKLALRIYVKFLATELRRGISQNLYWRYLRNTILITSYSWTLMRW